MFRQLAVAQPPVDRIDWRTRRFRLCRLFLSHLGCLMLVLLFPGLLVCGREACGFPSGLRVVPIHWMVASVKWPIRFE